MTKTDHSRIASEIFALLSDTMTAEIDNNIPGVLTVEEHLQLEMSA